MSAQIPEGAVIVTPAAMYAEQRATHDAVVSLSGEVKSLSHNVRQQQLVDARNVADHETRIRSLERKIWTLAGASAISGATIGSVAAAIIQAAHH